MAEGKKSFVAYSDWNGMFQALPDDVAGKLIKHIFLYVNDENPETDDFIINALFEQIKATLKRDLKKWDVQRNQRSEAGKRSAEVRASKSNERSTVVNETQRKSTVSVSVNDNDIKNNNTSTNVDLSFDFDVYIKTINESFGKNHRVATPKLKRQIKSLLKTGLTKDDIMTAIDNCKNSEFHKSENYRHCTPEFFSRIDKVDYWSDVKEVKKQKIEL